VSLQDLTTELPGKVKEAHTLTVWTCYIMGRSNTQIHMIN